MQTDKQAQGGKGEQMAADFLIQNGYHILERNYRIGHWEIDLIASNGEFLVIVEVKTRKSNAFGEPEDFVNKAKQRNLIRAANIYVERTGNTKEIRFDIVSVITGSGAEEIRHIENAFQPAW